MASDFDQLPDYNSLESAEYRSLSPGAIVGLVLGLLSPLALVTPLLGFLPIVAAAVSWFAIRSIRKSPETRTGAGFALAGLGLSVAVVAAVYAQGRVATSLHQAAAERVAEQFLDRLRGEDLAGAYELTLIHRRRLPTSEAAKMFYESDVEAGLQFAEFKDNPVIQSLAKGNEPQWLRYLELQKLRHGKLATGGVYAISDSDTEKKQRQVSLILERSSPRGSIPSSWRVTRFDFADSTDSGS